ncbi:serpin family protein [Endozoicomonas sp. ALC020]|uniref:serpin family protein n=1 Tax=unclassified Endozoicomonas TaxID=2644528 RepID=UPI003BB1317C
MQPLGYSIEQTSLSAQPLDLPDTSSKITVVASDVVKNLLDRVKISILDFTGKSSIALSSVGLAASLGMLLASMDDKDKKAMILGIPVEALTDELETEIHKELGQLSLKHAYVKHLGQKQAISCTNFIATKDATRDEQFEKRLSECYQTEKLECPVSCIADVTETYINDGKINNLFGGYSEAQRHEITAAIVNAMSFDFKGIWETSASSDKITTGNFICTTEIDLKKVKMMSTTDNFPIADNGQFIAIAKELKSVNGENLRLVAIKPRVESTSTITFLDSETIDHLIERLNDNKMTLNVKLPKINMETCENQLFKRIHQACEINTLAAVDLSKLGKQADQNLNMIQKITVTVDEQDTCNPLTNAEKTTVKDDPETPDFEFLCPGYIGIVDSEGNRLLDLVIKDDRFLETVENPDSDDLMFDSFDDSDSDDDLTPKRNYTFDARWYAVQKSANNIKNIEDAIETRINEFLSNPLRYGDMTILIQHRFNQDEELEIINARVKCLPEIDIDVVSLDDAKKLKKRILELIGEEYEDLLRLEDFIEYFRVEVQSNAWDALLEKLTASKS